MSQVLTLVRNGDPGSPSTVNTPLSQLQAGLTGLRNIVDDVEAGAIVVARRQPLESAAVLGSPVYWDTANQRFSLASAGIAAEEGLLALSDQAMFQGIVIEKDTADTGTVLFLGFTDAANVTAAIEGATGEGQYYLSGTPGRITKTRSSVVIPVLFITSTGKAIVTPQRDRNLDRHTHRSFSLVCRPAGESNTPTIGGQHTITEANPNRMGWLPAAHSSFGGNAPPQAVFGYNIAADAALAAAWPLDPVSACQLVWDKGKDIDVGGTVVPQGTAGLVIIDRNGIWWLSDCYDDAPWPADFANNYSTSYSDDDAAECPRHLEMSMQLHSVRPVLDVANMVVSSLISADPRLVIRCAGTTESATTGHLEIDLDLELGVAEEDSRGATVLKTLEDDQFTKGKVLEGIYALSSNVTLTSDLPTIKLDPDDANSANVYQGMVGLTVTPQETLELPVHLVRLNSVQEQYYEDTHYLGFQNGRNSSVRCRFNVPDNLSIPTPKLGLRLRILGRGAGTLPTLTVTGRRIPRPTDGLTTPEALPTSSSEFSVTITTAATVGANEYVEAAATAFTVAPGDVVLISISRSSGDAYAAELGLLKIAGILQS